MRISTRNYYFIKVFAAAVAFVDFIFKELDLFFIIAIIIIDHQLLYFNFSIVKEQELLFNAAMVFFKQAMATAITFIIITITITIRIDFRFITFNCYLE